MQLSVVDDGVHVGLEDLTVNAPTKIKHSDFLITVNTNYRPHTNEESYAMGTKLSHAIKQLLTHDHLPMIIDTNGSSYEEVMKSVNAEFGVEIGKKPQGRRIHAHCIIKIDHTGHIRLNIPEIKHLVKEFIDDPLVKGVYVNVKSVSSVRNIEDYIKKQGVSNKDI